MQAILDILFKPKQNYKDLRSLLKQIKQSGKNLPSLLLSVSTSLISCHKQQLGEDYYLLLEDFFYASIDTECYSSSDKVLRILYERFGKTDKIMKMQADFCESRGNVEKANECHVSILKDNLMDVFSMKKQISLLRVQGHLNKSVQMLNAYLTKYPSDQEGWLQMADCYMEVGTINKAQHCYGQLVMLEPSNLNYLLILAEVCQTVGGQQNLQTAKNYYCYILVQNSTNLRALYGLLTLLPKLKEEHKSNTLIQYVKKHIRSIYNNKNTQRLMSALAQE